MTTAAAALRPLLRPRRARPLPAAGRDFIGLFYCGLALVNAAYIQRNPDVLAFWSDHALFAPYRQLLHLLLPQAAQLVALSTAFDLLLGLLILSQGRRVRAGLWLGAGYNLLLAPLWLGQAPINLGFAAAHLALLRWRYDKSLLTQLRAAVYSEPC